MKYYYINDLRFYYNLEFFQKKQDIFWKQNLPLLEYLKTIGISLPHYCYNQNLPISGSCRACLVELKKSPKPVVSCAILVKSSLTNNVEIFTNSPLIQKSHENILEFLLLNHPLDCPICDQGGQCDLQDQSLFFGLSKKRFYDFKRIVVDKNVGPVIKTVMNRCIHCTRCVRFFKDVVGNKFFGALSRGVGSEIGTFLTPSVFSEFSGNVIDLCPVGALTAKPYFFVSRPWELKVLETFDTTELFSSKIQVFLKGNKVVKVLPSYGLDNFLNGWINNKTRFGFDYIFSNQRSLNGLVFKQKFKKVNWLNLFKEFLLIFYFQDHLLNHFKKVNTFLVLISSLVNLETLNFLTLITNKFSFFKLKKLEKAKKALDFQKELQLHTNICDLWQFDLCVLIDFNVKTEAPLLNLKLRQRYLKGHFIIFSFFPLTELNYLNYYLSADLKAVKSFFEGNHRFCNMVLRRKLPLFILGSNKSKSYKTSVFLKFTRAFKYIYTLAQRFKNSLQFIEPCLGSSSLQNLKKVPAVTTSDLKNFNVAFFLCFQLSKLKKFLDLKLLGYFRAELVNAQLFIDQNIITQQMFWEAAGSAFTNYKYLYLPATTLFETTNTFLNAQGFFRQSFKCVAQPGATKSSWQVLRKLFSQLKKIHYLSNGFTMYSNISYLPKSLHDFKNFVGYLSYPAPFLARAIFYSQLKTKLFDAFLFELFEYKTKSINSRFRKNLNDFFCNYLENFSVFSAFLLECSKVLRKNYALFKRNPLFIF